MPDRISRYRQVRVVLQVPCQGHHLAHWSLMAIKVVRGVPTNLLLDQGVVPLAGDSPTLAEVYAALDSLVASRHVD